MSKYKYEGYGVIRDTEMDFPYHTDDIAELLEEKDQQITDLQSQLAEKEKYTYTGEEVGKIEQNYDNQLAITEKALELACEHIKEDLKCDDTQDEIYNYFKNKAKEILENE